MKYSLKDHPYLFMAIVALLLCVCSIVLGYFYHWSVYSLAAIILSGIGALILFGCFVADYISFTKQKKK